MNLATQIRIGVLVLLLPALATAARYPAHAEPATIKHRSARFIRPYAEALGPLFRGKIWKTAPWDNLRDPLVAAAVMSIVAPHRDVVVGAASTVYLLQNVAHLAQHAPVLRRGLAKWVERNWKGSAQVGAVMGALLASQLAFAFTGDIPEFTISYGGLFKDILSGLWDFAKPAAPLMGLRAAALLHTSFSRVAAEHRLDAQVRSAGAADQGRELVATIEEVARHQRADARSPALVRAFLGLWKSDSEWAAARLRQAASQARLVDPDTRGIGELYTAVVKQAERLVERGDTGGVRQLGDALLAGPDR